MEARRALLGVAGRAAPKAQTPLLLMLTAPLAMERVLRATPLLGAVLRVIRQLLMLVQGEEEQAILTRGIRALRVLTLPHFQLRGLAEHVAGETGGSAALIPPPQTPQILPAQEEEGLEGKRYLSVLHSPSRVEAREGRGEVREVRVVRVVRVVRQITPHLMPYPSLGHIPLLSRLTDKLLFLGIRNE